MRDELFFFWTLSLVNWHGATSGNRIYCTGFMLLVYSTHIFMFWPSDTHTLTTGAVCNGFLLLVFPGAIFDKTRCYPPMLKWQVVIHVDTHTHREREKTRNPHLSLSMWERRHLHWNPARAKSIFYTRAVELPFRWWPSQKHNNRNGCFFFLPVPSMWSDAIFITWLQRREKKTTEKKKKVSKVDINIAQEARKRVRKWRSSGARRSRRWNYPDKLARSQRADLFVLARLNELLPVPWLYI